MLLANSLYRRKTPNTVLLVFCCLAAWPISSHGGDPPLETVRVLSELTASGYNTAPWPSSDGLRLYWETADNPSQWANAKIAMATRPNQRSLFGNPKILTKGRMPTLSPDELELVCVEGGKGSPLKVARRRTMFESFPVPARLSLPSKLNNPKSPAFMNSGLSLIVCYQQDNFEGVFLLRRDARNSDWQSLGPFPELAADRHAAKVTWPYFSADGLQIWFGRGGDREAQIWTGWRNDTSEAFSNFEAVQIDGKPLIGRAPRYVEASHELFFARPIGDQGWELAVVENYQTSKSLFNGKDLTNWTVVGHDGWKVEHGTIVGSTPERRSGWLMSNKKYSNFELQLEYMLSPDGNSGVFIHASPKGALNGKDFYEIQLQDETGRWRNEHPNKQSGALFGVLAPSPLLRPAPNKWHPLSICVEGRNLTVTIDGRQVVDGLILAETRDGGHIGLQLHHNQVQFRNIRVKELLKRTNGQASSQADPANNPSSKAASAAVEELKKAKQEFKDRMNSAMESMYSLFDKQKEIAVKRGDTHAVEILDKQRERFTRERILPSVVSTQKFEKDVNGTVRSIERIYQNAITDSGRNGDASQSVSLKAEAERLIKPYLFDGRRIYRRDGPAVYVLQPAGAWLETKSKPGDHVHFNEVKRTNEYIELKSKSTDVMVRLYADRVSLKHGYYPWGHFKKGRWMQ